jgi:hypothetical protein
MYTLRLPVGYCSLGKYKKNNSDLCGESYEIIYKPIGKNGELLKLSQVVHILSTVLQRVSRILGTSNRPE